MSVKQALKHYFAIRTEFYNKHKGVDLPIPQEPLEQSVYINFEKIEKELGFVIHTDIKDFLSSYWFDAIEGFSEYGYVNISGVKSIENVYNQLIVGFLMGNDLILEDAHYWYMGLYEHYSIFVNNTTGVVYAVVTHEQESKYLFDSIEDFIFSIVC